MSYKYRSYNTVNLQHLTIGKQLSQVLDHNALIYHILNITVKVNHLNSVTSKKSVYLAEI